MDKLGDLKNDMYICLNFIPIFWGSEDNFYDIYNDLANFIKSNG